MGNEMCKSLCVQDNNKNGVSLPNKQEAGKRNYKIDDIHKIIKIQRFYRNMKYMTEIRKQISKSKNTKRNIIKNQSCSFREGWETYFPNTTGVEFSINGLYSIKDEITLFYKQFFNFENLLLQQERSEELDFKTMIDGDLKPAYIFPSKFLVSQNKFSSVRKKNNFLKEFKILMLKQMEESFLMGNLGTDLEKINVEIQKVEMKILGSIEEHRTLENHEEEIEAMPEIEEENIQNKSVTNNLNNLFKEKVNYLENEDETFQKDPNPSNKSKNNKVSFGSNNEIWGKAPTNKSDKSSGTNYNSNHKTNFKTFTVNQSLLANQSRNKIILFKKFPQHEFESILEHISLEKDRECKYINFIDDNSVFYQGSWHLKKLCKYGLGYAYMTDASKGKRYKYYGYFKDDLYHGIGLSLYEDGHAYFGEFRNGVKCGYGKESKNNVTYRGFLKNNKYHGYGEYTYLNKISYCGGFSKGLRDGYGLLLMTDGALYCGNFKNNKMEGVGFFQWPAGQNYYGSWVEDKMNGLGHYKFANGDSYIGHYKNDLRHGRGEYYFKNGAALYGMWRHGKKEGKFELIENSKVYKISYRKDIQVAS